MQIYTKEGCGFSASLRELLDEREIPYEKVMVQEGTEPTTSSSSAPA